MANYLVDKICGSQLKLLRNLVLSHSDNTAYTAHFVRPNFGFAETSYMLETLYEIDFGTI